MVSNRSEQDLLKLRLACSEVLAHLGCIVVLGLLFGAVWRSILHQLTD